MLLPILNESHFSDIGEFPHLSNGFDEILILSRTWTHFGDMNQFPQLAYEFHGTLTLTCTHTHFGDIGEFSHLSWSIDVDPHLDPF